MVEQRVAVQDRHSRGSRALALGLTLGAAVVLWALMTGTAHAAEAPADDAGSAHGGVSHLLDQTPVGPLTHTVTHEVHHVVRTTRSAAPTHRTPHHETPRHDAVTTTVAKTLGHVTHLTRQVQQDLHQTVQDVTTPTAQGVRQGAAPVSHLLDVEAATVVPHATPTIAPGGSTHLGSPAGSAAPAESSSPASPDVARSVAKDHPVQHAPAAPRRADTPTSPAPTGSGTSSASGSGPGAVALVEHTSTPRLLASGEHSADPPPVPPAEPAYPPSCSPD